MANKSVSALYTVKILDPYHVLISRYEVPKVTRKPPIFVYWTTDKVLTAGYFEAKIL